VVLRREDEETAGHAEALEGVEHAEALSLEEAVVLRAVCGVYEVVSGNPPPNLEPAEIDADARMTSCGVFQCLMKLCGDQRA